jgi:hypothetical protein
MLGGATGLREIDSKIGMAVAPTPMHFRDRHMSGADGRAPRGRTGLISLRKYAQTAAAAPGIAAGERETSGMRSC